MSQHDFAKKPCNVPKHKLKTLCGLKYQKRIKKLSFKKYHYFKEGSVNNRSTKDIEFRSWIKISTQ